LNLLKNVEYNTVGVYIFLYLFLYLYLYHKT